MEIPFEQFAGKLEIESRLRSAAALDWRGLAARLAAVHATRQILAGQSDRRTVPSGSFAPAWAPMIGAHLAGAAVQAKGAAGQLENPTDQDYAVPIRNNSIEQLPTGISKNMFPETLTRLLKSMANSAG